MHQKTYVIRKKVIKIKPTPIPETTYEPEIIELPPSKPPIAAISPYFEELALPKAEIEPDNTPPPIPRYENPRPVFHPVDIRTNVATIERDACLQKAQIDRIEEAKKDEEGSQQFLKWQQNMKRKDEEERKEIIQKRHEDLDHARKNAIKIKQQQKNDKLALGNQMRSELEEQIAKTKLEIEEERQKIKELKKQRIDLAPINVEKVHREKREIYNDMRRDFKRDFKSARKQRREELEMKRKNVDKIKYEQEHHTNRHGDIFTSKREITETKFLAALTDEETNELLRTNHERNLQIIEERILKHRKAKEEKLQKLYRLLEEETRLRDIAEQEHKKKREEERQKKEEEEIKRQNEEDDKMIELEKKLEKKRKARIKEAEEMEERTRQIAARNRYLAINKRAVEVKAFQSHQDARLRMARERQDSRIQKPLRPPTPKKKKETELVRLKSILGV